MSIHKDIKVKLETGEESEMPIHDVIKVKQEPLEDNEMSNLEEIKIKLESFEESEVQPISIIEVEETNVKKELIDFIEEPLVNSITLDTKSKANLEIKFKELSTTQSRVKHSLQRNGLVPQTKSASQHQNDRRDLVEQQKTLQLVPKSPQHHCVHCGSGFIRKSNLTIHLRREICTKKHQTCSTCHKVFTSQESLDTHMLAHTNCDICGQKFGDNNALQMHKKDQHTKLQHQCLHPDCKKDSMMEESTNPEESSNAITIQVDVHHRHYSQLSASIATTSHDCVNEPETTSDLPSIHRDYPKTAAQRMAEYRARKKKETPIVNHRKHKKSDAERAKEYRARKKAKIQSAAFKTAVTLHQHIKNSHNKNSNYICSICNKCFRLKSYFNQHMLRHNNIRSFKCEECDQRCVTSSDLTKHIRLHNGDQRYSCETCMKTYRSLYDLSAHLRTHTGERPYACEVCPMRFVHSSVLKKHSLSHKFESHINLHSEISPEVIV